MSLFHVPLITIVLLQLVAAPLSVADDCVILSPRSNPSDPFQRALAAKRTAVTDITAGIQTVLSRSADWCAASRCSSSCALHTCSGEVADTCTKLTLSSCSIKSRQCPNTPGAAAAIADPLHKDLCDASDFEDPTSTLLNFKRAAFSTTCGAITSEGNGKPISIRDRDSRRDVCALNSLNSLFVQTHKRNQLSYWLYAGTPQKVQISYPGKPRCRGNGENPLADCHYDTTIRPWYTRSAAGTRDLVFLFDSTNLLSTPNVLRSALSDTLGTLDSRDRFAVVAYDSSVPRTLAPMTDRLLNATTDRIDALTSQISRLPGGPGSPNTTAALERAFDLFETTSGTPCSRQIILMSRRRDSCFASCTNSAPCTCVSDLLSLIKIRQSKLSSNPASILTFTEPTVSSEQSDMERVARTIVCTDTTSGISRRVLSSDTPVSVMDAFRRMSALRQFDTSTEVYSSGIYMDNGGLGEVFTLAAPVYDSSDSRLLAVAAADITLDEISSTTPNARDRVKKLSECSRKCPSRGNDFQCRLQNLRAQLPSTRCAHTLRPLVSESGIECFQFGSASYVLRTAPVSYDDAGNQCSQIAEGSRLAVANNSPKNQFLSGVYSLDGSWIGVTADNTGRFAWPDGSEVDVSHFVDGLNAKAVALEMQKESNEDRTCVVADRRGQTENWRLVSCDAQHDFVCELGTVNTTVIGGLCPEDKRYVYGTSDDDKINPHRCDTSGSGSRGCSAEQDQKADGADPLCNQTGASMKEAQRRCCPAQDTELPVLAIVLGTLGGLFLLIVLALLWYRFCYQAKRTMRSFCCGKNAGPETVPPPSKSQRVTQDHAVNTRDTQDHPITILGTPDQPGTSDRQAINPGDEDFGEPPF